MSLVALFHAAHLRLIRRNLKINIQTDESNGLRDQLTLGDLRIHDASMGRILHIYLLLFTIKNQVNVG